MKRVTAFLLLCALALSACAKQAEEPQPVLEKQTVVGFYFDTVVSLTAYAPDDSVLREALALCEGFEQRLSKTIEGSDVWRMNHANGESVEVSDDTLALLRDAKQAYDLSGGAFDVTIAPAAALWDFSEGAEPKLPDADALADAATHIDFTQIALDGSRVTVPNGMAIDLGGIAKGYIADRLRSFFAEQGVESALISLGGNVLTVGKKPDGSPWRVGIQDPDAATGTPMLVSEVFDLSVVTSGVYERGFDLDGVRYHHILDTQTGWPVQNEVRGVTIFSESSVTGDILSTTCLALGLERGLALIEAIEGVEALFITIDRDVHMTSGANRYLYNDEGGSKS